MPKEKDISELLSENLARAVCAAKLAAVHGVMSPKRRDDIKKIQTSLEAYEQAVKRWDLGVVSLLASADFSSRLGLTHRHVARRLKTKKPRAYPLAMQGRDYLYAPDALGKDGRLRSLPKSRK